MQVTWNVHSSAHKTSLDFLFRRCFTGRIIDHALARFHQIALVYYVVTIKNRPGLVPADRQLLPFQERRPVPYCELKTAEE